VNPLDGSPGPPPVGPLHGVVGLGAERPVAISDVVGAPVLFDLGGGLAPGSPTPGRLRHRSKRLQDIAGSLLLDSQPGGAPLPGQGPHHLPILRTEVGVGLQPAGPALLVLAQLPLPVVGLIDLLGGHCQPTRHPGSLVAAAAQPAKHARAVRAGGLLVGSQGFLGLLAVGGARASSRL
jgi:hypothetical protein